MGELSREQVEARLCELILPALGEVLREDDTLLDRVDWREQQRLATAAVEAIAPTVAAMLAEARAEPCPHCGAGEDASAAAGAPLTDSERSDDHGHGAGKSKDAGGRTEPQGGHCCVHCQCTCANCWEGDA